MLAVRDTLSEDPDMSKRALMATAKSAMVKEDAGKRMQHAWSQGQVFRCSADGAVSIWPAAVQKLPPELRKFSLNAVQDTLPHNASLAMWRRREGLSSACKLCGKRQTLLHILSNFPKHSTCVGTTSDMMLSWKSSPSSGPRAYQRNTNLW